LAACGEATAGNNRLLLRAAMGNTAPKNNFDVITERQAAACTAPLASRCVIAALCDLHDIDLMAHPAALIRS
jgi:hypothetical protein